MIASSQNPFFDNSFKTGEHALFPAVQYFGGPIYPFACRTQPRRQIQFANLNQIMLKVKYYHAESQETIPMR